jgi:hypothetical protein
MLSGSEEGEVKEKVRENEGKYGLDERGLVRVHVSSRVGT